MATAIAVLVLIVAAAAFFHGPVVAAAEPTAPAGDNGIVDPPAWPPRQGTLTREPLPRLPYLVSPAAVIVRRCRPPALRRRQDRADGPDDPATVIEPFTRANCDSVSVDKTLVAVKCTDGADLATLADKPVRIRSSEERRLVRLLDQP